MNFTPKGHLSFSQISLWERSASLYLETYIFGNAHYQNDAMAFGSKFAKSFIENSEDINIEISKYYFLSFPKNEFELNVKIPYKKEDISFKAIFDGYSPKTGHIGERKTGQSVWNQRKVDLDDQLTCYAYVHWLKYKKIPNRLTLEWLPTYRDDNGEIKIKQSKPLVFETKRSVRDFIIFYPRIIKAYLGIGQLMKKYVGY